MNFALILAGGVGSRMGESIPKQYLIVENKPVLVYSLERLQNCDRIDKIIIVADTVWREDIEAWMKQYNITKFLSFADPGATRQDSVFSGLTCCKEYAEGPQDIVLVHESARALASHDLICRIIDGLEGYDACMPVLPMKDAILLSYSGETIDGLLDRSTLFCGQAPESFWLLPYWELNHRLSDEERAASCADHELCFKNNWKVHCIAGEENCFKLTTPGDIDRMVSLLRAGKV